MSNLMFRTTSTDRTVVEAVIEAAHDPRRQMASSSRIRSAGALTYKRLLPATAILGAQADAAGAARASAVGVMLPNANGAVVTMLALMSAGRVPAMINFTAGAANILGACRAAQVDTIVTVARLRREGAARRSWSAALEQRRPHRLSGRRPRRR